MEMISVRFCPSFSCYFARSGLQCNMYSPKKASKGKSNHKHSIKANILSGWVFRISHRLFRINRSKNETNICQVINTTFVTTELHSLMKYFLSLLVEFCCRRFHGRFCLNILLSSNYWRLHKDVLIIFKKWIFISLKFAHISFFCNPHD